MFRSPFLFFAAQLTLLMPATGLSSTWAQDVNSATDPDSNVRQQTAEVAELQQLITHKRLQMVNVARFSAFGYLDPAYQDLAAEVEQLDEALAQRMLRITKQNARLRQDDLTGVLTSITSELTEVRNRLNMLEAQMQAQAKARRSWKKTEIDGKQYYLVPVEEVDTPFAFPGKGPKIINTNSLPPRPAGTSTSR